MNTLQKKIQTLFGESVQVVAKKNVAGGCINDTGTLHLSNGETLFLKQNNLTHPQMFEAEAMGLKMLVCDGGPRIPTPIAAFRDNSSQYLLLEFLDSSGRVADYFEQFGRQLAHMHQTIRRDRFGFDIDNFIGATPQYNEHRDSWVHFFGEMRLEPQIKMASSQLGRELRKSLSTLLEKLDQFIIEPEGNASIIHGDLWSGNAMTGPNGEPVIIDPAPYFGHREAEIAMTQLFGRFGGHFYAAYNEYWPMQNGWQDRMDMYNLYHMLNHVNLFGSGYMGGVSSIVYRYV
ncbi:MAG: fructosamine kinase family protein [Deltaproteobacteria bacterium]|nr:fructosamine kinase family protein [Deltaproteobacteria bacterium]